MSGCREREAAGKTGAVVTRSESFRRMRPAPPLPAFRLPENRSPARCRRVTRQARSTPSPQHANPAATPCPQPRQPRSHAMPPVTPCPQSRHAPSASCPRRRESRDAARHRPQAGRDARTVGRLLPKDLVRRHALRAAAHAPGSGAASRTFLPAQAGLQGRGRGRSAGRATRPPGSCIEAVSRPQPAVPGCRVSLAMQLRSLARRERRGQRRVRSARLPAHAGFPPERPDESRGTA